MSIETRLPHSSGANVDEPHVDALLRLEYADGEWSLARAHVDEDGQVKTSVGDAIPFELAQQITESAGLITAEVVRRNHLMYAEALEAKTLAESERSAEHWQERLDQARALKASLQSDDDGVAASGETRSS